MCLSIGPTSCFYWASKLPRGTFWAGLKTFKSLAAAFEGLSTAQPSAAALEASCWLCHGASMCLSIGPTSCFYWASKLPRGTFWAGLKTFKSLAAAFEGLSTAQPSAAALEVCCWFCHGASLLAPKAAAAFEGLSTAQPSAAALAACCWLCHGASLLAPKAVSIGLRNCRVARFGQALKPSKASQQLSKASAPHNPPQQLSKCAAGLAMVPPYWFWAGLKTFKSLAAAFEGLSTAQPSAAALEASRLLCHGASLLAPKAVSIGLRNCRVARFGQALTPSKASQQLSQASAPHNPPQQLSKRPAGFAMVPPCAFLTLRSSSRSVLLASPYWRQKLFLLGFETAPWHVLGRP